MPRRSALNIEQKKALVKTREIECGICPYRRGENGLGKRHRRPKDDRHKNHRRK